MKLRLVRYDDIKKGLKETLEALAPVGDVEGYVFNYAVRRRRDRMVLTYVAVEDDGSVVGTGSVIIEPKIIHGCGQAAHIEDVAIHPAHQGKDIGKLVMEKLIKEVRRRGCYKVILNCNETNAGFYEKLGFKRQDVGMRLDINAPVGM